MADPTAIIGTVDLITRRLSDLRIRYKHWISNPEEYQRLSLELEYFIQDLNNIKIRMKDISTDQHKIEELHHVIHSINSLFDKSKQDLDELEKNIPNDAPVTFPNPFSTSSENLHQQADGQSHVHPVTNNSTEQSLENKSNDHDKPIRIGAKRFKKSTQQTAKNLKSFTRVKRDTTILKEVDDSLREGRNLLLHVSNFIHLQLSGIFTKRDSPKFTQHFDSPFQSPNWVVDFSLTPSNTNPNTEFTSNMVTDATESSMYSNNISQEAQVKQTLLSFLPDPNQAIQPTQSNGISSLCVYGQGGMGKSVALQSICYDQQLRTKFYDGIHFFTLGQNATTQDVIQQFSMCTRHAGYEQLSRNIMEMKSADEAAREVSVIFKGKRVLFVADDLWVSERSGTGFLREIQVMGGMSAGAILFSTREESLAREGKEKVFFDFLDAKGNGSRMILERCIRNERSEGTVFKGLDEEAKRALDEILELCGGWKLCLAVAGGALSEDIRDCGNDTSLGLTNYVTTLQEDEEGLIYETTADYHDRNLVTIAESSVGRCREWSEKRAIRRLCDGELGIEEMFRSLCVIEKQKWMGVKEVCRMWGVSERYGGTIVKQMGRMNLVSRKLERADAGLTRLEKRERKDEEWVIRVHDRMIDVCVDLAGKKDDEGTKRWHKLLLDRYIQKYHSNNATEFGRNEELETEVGKHIQEWDYYKLMRKEGEYREWWDQKKVNGTYIMKNLARHLLGGGMWDELFYVLTDVRWTLRRVEEGGLADLRDDFDRVIDVIKEYEKKSEQPDDIVVRRRRESDGVQILVDVISDCWHVLLDENYQFGFQVFGRIHEQYGRYCAVLRYMLSIERNGPRPWYKPMRTGLLAYEDTRQRGQLKLEGDSKKVIFSPGQEYICTSEFSEFSGFPVFFEFPDLESTNIPGSEVPVITVKIFLVDWRSRESERFLFEVRKRPECFDFCFSTWQVAFGFEDGTIEIRDAKTGILCGNPLCGHDAAVTHVAFNELGSRLGSRSDDGSVRIWNIFQGEPLGKPFTWDTRYKEKYTFTETDDRLKSVSAFHDLFCILPKEADRLNEPLFTDWGHENPVIFSGDYSVAIVKLVNHTSQVVNIHKGTVIGKPLVGNTSGISSADLSQNSSVLIAGYEDGSIRLWNVSTGSPIGTPLLGHTSRVTFVGFREDDTSIISSSTDGSLRFWNISSNDKPSQAVTPKDRPVPSSRFWVFSGDRNRFLCLVTVKHLKSQLWDLKMNQSIGVPLDHGSDVECIALNEDGTRLIMGLNNSSVQVWDVDTSSLIGHPLIKRAEVIIRTGNILDTHTSNEGGITCVVLNKNGNFAAAASDDFSLQVWDVNSGKAYGKSLVGHEDRVKLLSFSNDGKHVASGSKDMTTRIWNTETSSEIGVVQHQSARQYKLPLLFNCGNNCMIFGTQAGFVGLWSIDDRREICTPLQAIADVRHAKDNLEHYKRWLRRQVRLLNRSIPGEAKQTHTCVRTLNNDMNRIFREMGFSVCKRLECESGDQEICKVDEWEKQDNKFNTIIVDEKSVSVMQSDGKALSLADTVGYVKDYKISGDTVTYFLRNKKVLECKVCM